MKSRGMLGRRAAACVLVCVSLAGCVGVAGLMGAQVKAYDGPDKPDGELAILVKSFVRGRPSALLSKVDDVTYGDNMLRGYPTVVKVLPGVHKITVICYTGKGVGFPSKGYMFEAGHYYELMCAFVDSDHVRAYIEDRGTESILPKKAQN